MKLKAKLMKRTFILLIPLITVLALVTTKQVQAATNTIMTTYYEAHAANIGWTKTYNGTQQYLTKNARIEAVSVATNGIPNVKVLGTAQVQDIGWIKEKDITSNIINPNLFIGTTGKGKRLEAFKLRLSGSDAAYYTIQYQAYVQGKGWTSVVSDGAVCGTVGKGLALYGVKITIVKKKPINTFVFNQTLTDQWNLKYGNHTPEKYTGKAVGRFNETLFAFASGKIKQSQITGDIVGDYNNDYYDIAHKYWNEGSDSSRARSTNSHSTFTEMAEWSGNNIDNIYKNVKSKLYAPHYYDQNHFKTDGTYGRYDQVVLFYNEVTNRVKVFRLSTIVWNSNRQDLYGGFNAPFVDNYRFLDYVFPYKVIHGGY